MPLGNPAPHLCGQFPEHVGVDRLAEDREQNAMRLGVAAALGDRPK